MRPIPSHGSYPVEKKRMTETADISEDASSRKTLQLGEHVYREAVRNGKRVC
jgi:hypothetical protein